MAWINRGTTPEYMTQARAFFWRALELDFCKCRGAGWDRFGRRYNEHHPYERDPCLHAITSASMPASSSSRSRRALSKAFHGAEANEPRPSVMSSSLIGRWCVRGDLKLPGELTPWSGSLSVRSMNARTSRPTTIPFIRQNGCFDESHPKSAILDRGER